MEEYLKILELAFILFGISLLLSFILFLLMPKKDKNQWSKTFGIYDDEETEASILGVDTWNEKQKATNKPKQQTLKKETPKEKIKLKKDTRNIIAIDTPKGNVEVNKKDISSYGLNRENNKYYVTTNSGKKIETFKREMAHISKEIIKGNMKVKK